MDLKGRGGVRRRSAARGARVVATDPWWQWADPNHVVTEFHHCHPDVFIAAALPIATRADSDWLQRWLALEHAAQAAIERVLASEVSEPMVARMVARVASELDATIVVSASMPMRDLEWFAPALVVPPKVLANRGANGIDGVTSTALGVAASGHRTIALLGDLAFLHDVSGLVDFAGHPCTFVVVDNRGGGIFSFLPQSGAFEPDEFELLFGTPPTPDVGQVARGFGLEVHDVSRVDELESALALPPPCMIHVRVPSRSQNVVIHGALNEAVRLSLG